MNKKAWILTIVLAVGLIGCTTSEKAATVGGLGGATLGGIIGHNTGGNGITGAAIGGVVGAVGGMIVGDKMDTKFCPVGGEHYTSDVQFCPVHGVELKTLEK